MLCGLVFMGENLFLSGRGFESQHQILDGLFSHQSDRKDQK